MPRPDLPMTPAASTDLTGQEKSSTPTEPVFSLGPPALRGATQESSSSSTTSAQSSSSYHPNSPAPAPSSRKRSRPSPSTLKTDLAASHSPSTFSLPPPPSRSRKIIQMKPGGTPSKPTSTSTSTLTPNPETNKKKTAAQKSSSAANKKSARKTAHSVIERRRRSKMNEEFDTMKEMIPACRGQSMHKLAILQAGIDYLRYLERCVEDLKSANQNRGVGLSQAPTPRPRSRGSEGKEEDDDDDDDEGEGEGEGSDEDEDEDMQDADVTPSTSATNTPFAFIPSVYSSTQPSPASGLLSGANGPALSRSSTITSLPSPAFCPLRPDYSHSVESSPALLPNVSRDADQEATAALLMLNKDRRGSMREKRVGGGLSVQDLLSG